VTPVAACAKCKRRAVQNRFNRPTSMLQSSKPIAARPPSSLSYIRADSTGGRGFMERGRQSIVGDDCQQN
jgi:hypothetical protein